VIAGTVEMVVAENEPGDERERVPRRLKNKNRRAHSAR
jgi:hypothetical protein